MASRRKFSRYSENEVCSFQEPALFAHSRFQENFQFCAKDMFVSVSYFALEHVCPSNSSILCQVGNVCVFFHVKFLVPGFPDCVLVYLFPCWSVVGFYPEEVQNSCFDFLLSGYT